LILNFYVQGNNKWFKINDYGATVRVVGSVCPANQY